MQEGLAFTSSPTNDSSKREVQREVRSLERPATKIQGSSNKSSADFGDERERANTANQASMSAEPSAGDEAIRAPPSSKSVWDDSEVEVQEPMSESSTELDRDSWQDTQRKTSVDSAEQPSRQEDTELGIFRPDEL